jgi:hypothetical protein
VLCQTKPSAIPAVKAPCSIHINSPSVPSVFQCTVHSLNGRSKVISSTQLELSFKELNTEQHKRQYKYVKSISECSCSLRSGIFIYQVTIGTIRFMTIHVLSGKIKMTFCHSGLQKQVTCELDSKTLNLRVTQILRLLREKIFFGVFPSL